MLSKTAPGELRRALKDAGAFEHHSAATVFKLVAFLSLAIGLVLVSLNGPWWLALALAPFAGAFCAGAAMIGHEGAHRSFAKSPWANEVLAHVTFPLFSGLGVQHWKNKHNRAHHGYPNVEHIDDDINLWPMATSARFYRESSAPRRWFQRNVQGPAFWPLSFVFLAAVMRMQSILYLVDAAKQGRFGKAHAADLLCQLVHYGLWLGLGSYFFGFGTALLVYVSVWCFVGLYLAAIFSPAHMGLPIHADEAKGWEHQIATTRNLGMPWWVSLFACGLDYQLEHHLFPKIPHQNLPRAAEITREWCERHGQPHRTIPFFAGLADVTRFMSDAWQIEAENSEAPSEVDEPDAIPLAS